MRRAVILAGGKGTRLAPYTVNFPKPLMPLDDVPILEVVLTQLLRSGFDSATLAVGHLAGLIEAYFGAGERVGIPIDYAREDAPLGTAGPLGAIIGLDEPFLVMNGDILSTLDYGLFLEDHARSGAVMSIATRRRKNVVDFGVLGADEAGRVLTYHEKPSSEYLVSMGVYALSPAVLQLICPGVHLDLPELVQVLLDTGADVRSVEFDGYWLDIGRADDFAQAQSEFAGMRGAFLAPAERNSQ